MDLRIRRSAALFGSLGLVASVLTAGCAGPVASQPGDAPSPSAGATAPSSAPAPLASGSASASASPPAPLVLLSKLPTAILDRATAAEMQEVLESAVKRGAPDVIAAVITEEGTWAGAAGIGGPEGRKATPDDEFAIASITKTFTAALIMRLAEQGRLDLDAPLAGYLGDLQVDTNDATVRHALEMRTGLPDNGSEVADQIVADPSRAWTKEEIVERYAPPTGAAGDYRYASPNYEILAFVAAHVTGMSYGSALRAEVLDPVGADRILDQEAGVVTPKPWAVPIDHHLGRFTAADMGAGGALSCISSATRGTGAGSMASDAPSLAAWLWHLFSGDILAPASLEQMLPTGNDGWAYGFDRAPYAEAGSVANSGGKTGYGSQFVFFPSSRAIVVIFVNDPDFVVEPTVNALLHAAVS